MKILHIASFVGNIGDNMSHIGLNCILGDLFEDYQVERLEIRKFYKNYTGKDKEFFDESFLSKLGGFDLCIIGGGGFLDYWVEGSASGTTIDITSELVSRISTPVIISSVGCIPHREVPDGNIDKFKAFLSACANNPLVKIILRNDGSLNNIFKTLGQGFTAMVDEGIDNAFFIKGELSNELPFENDYVAVNVAGDQLHMNSEFRKPINTQLYYDQLGAVVTHICQVEKKNVVLVPHIYSDLKAISSLLDRVNDFTIRTQVAIAPCVQYDRGAKAISAIYQKSQLTIGMRFHANIIPIALGRPAIGLVALDRVKHMYDSLGMENSYVLVDGKFSDALCEMVSDALSGRNSLTPDLNNIKVKAFQRYTSALQSLGLTRA